ncbi:unnamed protein product [Kuraishia capsulata CBS 1993]|uniref:Autophagy-related protein 18 n=1 Tax=Kuraishia capsulata CBS 1993 TaxID=1382522 RepID=W6ML56_9ASCO|nr:uncharacterized protein KUCA_T00003168001 [Kuraishia capsulata CBS 1993]CDK27191.1 unnamed protein product [Kuraishia capsulata CBS 1993]
MSAMTTNSAALEFAKAASEATTNFVQSHYNNKDSINFANFNQDFSCISVGYESGYKIFNCEPFGKCYTKTDGSVGIVEMLFSSSLVAMVGLGEHPALSPRRLKIVNTKRQTTICELTFPTSILAVKMNRERLVVLLEETIYIYDINNMRLLHTIEIPSNPNSLIALSPTTDSNYLAYPSPPKIPAKGNSNNDSGQNTNGAVNNGANSVRHGDVIIFNAKTLQPLSVIEAHKTSLAAMTLSLNGLLLATASDKGTIVRVFSVETGAKLYQFRRGTYPTKIYSLAFSPDNRFVIASSATETVHIFKLGDDETPAPTSGPALSAVQSPSLKKSSDSEVSDDEEQEDDVEGPPTTLGRRASTTSLGSLNSTESGADKVEPLVDHSRRSVGRMIRRTSQSIGRKAAERMGTYLPPKFSSILEPNRHFASLKVPTSKDTKTVVGIAKMPSLDLIPSVLLDNGSAQGSMVDDSSSDLTSKKLLHIMIVSSEGFFYKFGLDPERGGDCILLSQYSLLNDTVNKELGL